MKGIGLKKRNRRDIDKAKEQFWDKIEEIPDENIRTEVSKGRKVRIISSSEDIEIPNYPSDSEY
jgi:hypothetical protein